MVFGHTSYYGDRGYWGRRTGRTLVGLVIAVVVIFVIFAFRYYDEYEGLVTEKRISYSYRRRGGRSTEHNVYFRRENGKVSHRDVTYSVYNKARPGMIICKKRGEMRAKIYTQEEWNALKRGGGDSGKEKSRKARYHSPSETTREQIRKAQKAKAKEEEEAGGALPAEAAEEIKAAVSDYQKAKAKREAAASPPKPRKVELPKLDDVIPEEDDETAAADKEEGEAAAEPEPEPEVDMTTVYWVRLNNGRELMALRCEQKGSRYHVALPRGIKTSLPTSSVKWVREEEIETALLDEQLKKMKERVERRKKQKKLERVLGGRR